MTIELNFHDLMRLAASTEVVKGGVTIKVKRPVHPMVNMPAANGNEYVAFVPDSSDRRSKDFTWDATIRR